MKVDLDPLVIANKKAFEIQKAFVDSLEKLQKEGVKFTIVEGTIKDIQVAISHATMKLNGLSDALKYAQANAKLKLEMEGVEKVEKDVASIIEKFKIMHLTAIGQTEAAAKANLLITERENIAKLIQARADGNKEAAEQLANFERDFINVGKKHETTLNTGINKEKALLDKRLKNLDEHLKAYIALLDQQRAELDFNQTNYLAPDKILSRIDYENKITDLIKAREEDKIYAEKIEQLKTLKTFQEGVVKDQASSLVNAVRMVESSSTSATSPGANQVSSAGARGAMQVTPIAWKEIHGTLEGYKKANLELLDFTGQAYLKQQLDRYKDRYSALAAYTMGPTSVDKMYARRGATVGQPTPEIVASLKQGMPDDVNAYIDKIQKIVDGAIEKSGDKVKSKVQNKVEVLDIKTLEQIDTLEKERIITAQKYAEEIRKQNRDNITHLYAYKKALVEIDATALESQGKTIEAAQLRIDLKYQEFENYILFYRR